MYETPFIYLDGKEEREALIREVTQIRTDIQTLALQVPTTEHYTPNYAGRSLAQVLAALELGDALALMLLKATLNGYKLALPSWLTLAVWRVLLWVSNRRLVDVSLQGIQKYQTNICQLIREISLDSLSLDVQHPGRPFPYTLEKALQIYFVHRWRQQLALLHGRVESEK